LFGNIALSLALTAATASTKHFGAKVIKYFALMLQLHGSQISKLYVFGKAACKKTTPNSKKNRNAHSTKLQTK